MKPTHSPAPYSAPEALEARIAPAILFAYDAASDSLISFDSAKPSFLLSKTAVSGLGAGEEIVALDFRPETGVLFAVTKDAGAAGRLYTLNLQTAAATPVGGSFVPLLETAVGATFDIDFNPVVDLIRLVSSGGQNLRINPNTGAAVDANSSTPEFDADTNLAYGPGDTNAGNSPHVAGIAYTNSFADAAQTTFLALDASLDVLSRGDVPNSGVLSTVGKTKVPAAAIHGFDILPGSSSGFAAMSIGSVDKLYTVNLATGAARIAGNIGPAGTQVVSLAALPSGLGIVGSTATFTDQDGDVAKITFSKGTPSLKNFSFSLPAENGGVRLQSLDLTPGTGAFSGASIAATGRAGALGGNGHVDVGFINAAGVNLSTLSVQGDVARLSLGTATDDGLAAKKITLGSVGLLGSAYLPAPAASSVEVLGDVGAFSIIHGTSLTTVSLEGAVKSLTVGGVSYYSNFEVSSASSVRFSSMLAATFITEGNATAISAASTVQANISIGGTLSSFTVGGDFYNSGLIVAAPNGGKAVNSVVIKGSVSGGQFLFGTTAPAGGNVQVGSITVQGDFFNSLISAGILSGSDAAFGTGDDAVVAKTSNLPSRIASIVIRGNFFESPEANALGVIQANQLGFVSLGGQKMKLTSELDFFRTNGAFVREYV